MTPYHIQALEAEAKGEYGRAEKLWHDAMMEVQGTSKHIEYTENFVRCFNEYTKRLRALNTKSL